MWAIRGRFEVIETLKKSESNAFSRAESAAFHGRKIVEAIAFSCLVAIDNGLKNIPKDAKGKWNAEDIFKKLKKKNLEILPSPSKIRHATNDEKSNLEVQIVIEGIPKNRLTHEELIQIYQRFHAWLHEINPYVHQGQDSFYESKSEFLWKDLDRLRLFIERHFISINGSGFYCVLNDSVDNKTKVMPLAKAANYDDSYFASTF
jgi:hypothetical protein